jgi:hypothetical protein
MHPWVGIPAPHAEGRRHGSARLPIGNLATPASLAARRRGGRWPSRAAAPMGRRIHLRGSCPSTPRYRATPSWGTARLPPVAPSFQMPRSAGVSGSSTWEAAPITNIVASYAARAERRAHGSEIERGGAAETSWQAHPAAPWKRRDGMADRPATLRTVAQRRWNSNAAARTGMARDPRLHPLRRPRVAQALRSTTRRRREPHASQASRSTTLLRKKPTRTYRPPPLLWAKLRRSATPQTEP